MAQSAASDYTGGFSGLYLPLRLAPAAAEAQGAGGTVVDDEKARAAELANKPSNPVASVISVPIQNNWDFGIGSANAKRYTANIQPVIPFSIGWTYGVLANHLWSVAGEGSRADVNATFLQPFVSYTTKTITTFGLNTESTYDWANSS